MDNNAMQAVILRIEKSSIYDGDGLRTVVFLKGCNLNCLWCSTPESQDRRVEMGFDATRCEHCGSCLDICPEQAISRDPLGAVVIDKNRCKRCKRCHDICPYQAFISYGRLMSMDDVLGEVLKDDVFYYYSGGGLTVSGGEPLLYADFVAELLKRCRDNSVNTAIETSFCLSWLQVKKVLPYLDTLFVDLKHSDSASHERLTGLGNDLVLANIMLADMAPQNFDIIIRLPLIPGSNDSEDNLRQTAALCVSLKKLRGLQLLPYHRLGSATYAKLGRDYALQDLSPPTEAYMAEKYGLIRRFYPDLPLI